MEYEDDRKTDFTRDELLEIINSFLEYKPVFDEKFDGVDMDSIRHPKLDYPTGMTHTYIGYDYTYVEIAYNIYGVVSEYNLNDFDYGWNMQKIRGKYHKSDPVDLSDEKLDFLEIMTIFTFIDRFDRHADGLVYEHAVEDGTFYKLLCRLEEIKGEIINQ